MSPFGTKGCHVPDSASGQQRRKSETRVSVAPCEQNGKAVSRIAKLSFSGNKARYAKPLDHDDFDDYGHPRTSTTVRPGRTTLLRLLSYKVDHLMQCGVELVLIFSASRPLRHCSA